MAVTSEVSTAVQGDRASPVPVVTDPMCRQLDSPWPPSTRSDRSSSAATGSTEMTRIDTVAPSTASVSPTPRGGRAIDPRGLENPCRRRESLECSPRVATTARSWMLASTAAPGRSNCWVARTQISTSIVVTDPPPRMTITPKLVRQNRNTTTADESTAGPTAGRTTRRAVAAGPSPSVLAADSRSGPRSVMAALTILITTARLKHR